ncbi:hypothetical protein CLV62_101229 [Dysgonomonas alginatilytica]|uniref:Uncharacterized protein n=1 Tax=Dysgonomonas alginatilytica TaxID=1605892 RepID=A0A2V3PTL3_9BACT|nr:hypothetical protein [Dysgonomonas alginatilytica]PXV68963.1 hypothetical protein CLV62_101229 [Dysgonomonas alginatilytica]
MKYLTLLISLIIIPLEGFSQIGINTDNITSSNILLHIDPAKDNAASGTPTTAQTKEDIVIDKSGNLGVGTSTPTVKLDIVTAGTSASPVKGFSIRDGYQADKYVLTSDNSGTAYWQVYVPGTEKGVMGSGINISNTYTNYVNTNTKISLYPGKWVVFVSLNILGNGTNPDFSWMNFGFADASTLASLTLSADEQGTISAALFNDIKASPGSSVNGKIFITNKSSGKKDYYLLAGKVVRNATSPNSATFQAVGSTGNLYAFRVNDITPP